MANRSFLMSEAVVMTKTNQISNLEMRLLNISAEKTLKHAEGSAKIAQYTSKMNFLTNNARNKLGDDYSSDEYKQYLAEAESIENEYMTIIEGLRDQMQEAEDKLDTQQQTVQVQLEALRAEQEEWKKLTQEKAEAAGYFKSGG